jgi:type I site-specific restriction endonuclease
MATCLHDLQTFMCAPRKTVNLTLLRISLGFFHFIVIDECHRQGQR